MLGPLAGAGTQVSAPFQSMLEAAWKPRCRSFLRQAGGMELFGRSRVGSIKVAISPAGDPDKRRARTLAASGLASLPVGQAADLAVAEAVIDEREEFAGGGHLGDAVAAAVGDPVAVALEVAAGALALDRFDRGPADQA